MDGKMRNAGRIVIKDSEEETTLKLFAYLGVLR
jgi:hypothetical protein